MKRVLRFNAKGHDFICAKLKEKDLYALMVYNPTRKWLYQEERIHKDYLSGVDSFGNPYAAVEVSRKTFDVIFNKLFKDYGAREGFFYHVVDEEKEEEKKIEKELVLKGIRGNLSADELGEIVQKPMEQADYYDYEAFTSMIYKFMRGEVDTEYYRDWTILVSWALNNHDLQKDCEKSILYEELSWAFDGHSFDEFRKEKDVQCRGMLAGVKYTNHLIKNLSKKKKPLFYNDGKVVVYCRFDFCNSSNTFYKLCVVDRSKKVFAIKSVVNVDYLENINYTFLDADEFDELTNEYYEYFLDKDMDVSKYIREREFILKKIK